MKSSPSETPFDKKNCPHQIFSKDIDLKKLSTVKKGRSEISALPEANDMKFSLLNEILINEGNTY